jgi:predicted nucleic acid-binding protein
MKILFDTNVLIAAIIKTHSHHSIALPWLKKAKRKEITAVIGVHSRVEIYAILTRLPIYPKISPALAEQFILQDILPHFEVIELSRDDYRTVLHLLSTNNVEGGATYDALICHAAFKAQVDKLYTFNVKHFNRIYPPVSHLVEEPS